MASNILQENEKDNLNDLYENSEKEAIEQENSEHILFGKSEKVSQLETQVDALTEENSELFLLLQNERRKSKQLESKLEHCGSQESSSDQDWTGDLADFAQGQETAIDFLQDVVVMMKKKFDKKESECEELEDKLCVMNQELVAQKEELARTTKEFQHQLKHLHELLAQERNLNSLLSDESDQTVRELETRIQKKDEINTELKFIQDETFERIQSIKEECRFYQTKLHHTETRLRTITSEHEQSVIETDSVSCQVSESELQAFEETENETRESTTFNNIFAALWDKGDVNELHEIGNAARYKINIFNVIRNGFNNLGSIKNNKGNIKL